MRVATWNVNSLRARQDLVLDWLRRTQPDVLCMQETKVEDDDFPTDELQRMGYSVVMAGQKSYNGVAIAARKLIRNVKIGLLDSGPDEDKRILSAQIGKLHVFCCYVPNGKSVLSPDFEFKLSWLGGLRRTLDAWADPGKDIVVCGDFNIARDTRDLFDPQLFEGQTHFHPREHAALNEVLSFGLVDTFRELHPEGGRYTWWDYRAGAFQRDQGLRIDYVFASRSLAQRCTNVELDVDERRKDKPSDHIPVIAQFSDP
ncbi:MAG TPA: exodeoxyribonuclease III [Polyangiaceae bacterium]|nr:exodeoxyribonuclease III [Polyangiaceae bacterium]